MLAGGGLAGIAWETGILRGIEDASAETARMLLNSDVLLGTSAGSAVAAQLGSGVGLDALYDRQISGQSKEINPSVDIDDIAELFLEALLRPWRDDGAEAATHRGGRTLHGRRVRGGPPRGDRPAVAVP